MNRREKIHHITITELEEDGKKLYKEKKELENFIDEKKKIFFDLKDDLEDDFKDLSDKYKQIKLNNEISRAVNKKLEDKIEKS